MTDPNADVIKGYKFSATLQLRTPCASFSITEKFENGQKTGHLNMRRSLGKEFGYQSQKHGRSSRALTPNCGYRIHPTIGPSIIFSGKN